MNTERHPVHTRRHADSGTLIEIIAISPLSSTTRRELARDADSGEESNCVAALKDAHVHDQLHHLRARFMTEGNTLSQKRDA